MVAGVDCGVVDDVVASVVQWVDGGAALPVVVLPCGFSALSAARAASQLRESMGLSSQTKTLSLMGGSGAATLSISSSVGGWENLELN